MKDNFKTYPEPEGVDLDTLFKAIYEIARLRQEDDESCVDKCMTIQPEEKVDEHYSHYRDADNLYNFKEGLGESDGAGRPVDKPEDNDGDQKAHE